MWWDFHRLMDLTPEQLVDEDEPIGGARTGRADRRDRRRASSRVALPVPGTGVRHRSAGRVYDPADSRPSVRTTAPSSWDVGDVRRGRPGRADGRHQACPGRPAPEAIVPLAWIRTHGPAGQRSSSSGSGSPSTASTPTDRTGPRATCCCGRPPRAGQDAGASLAGDGETDLDAARRLALDPRPTPCCRSRARPDPARPTRGARMIVDAAGGGQAGRASPGRATRSSATSSTAVLDAADERAPSTSGPIQHGQTRTRSLVDDPRRAGEGRVGRRGPARRRAGQPRRRDDLALGLGEDARARSTSCSSTRPARSRSPTSSPSPRGGEPGAAR